VDGVLLPHLLDIAVEKGGSIDSLYWSSIVSQTGDEYLIKSR